MNVLFLASWYPSQVSPQNGNFIQQHAWAVSKYCQVAVLHVVSREQFEKFVIDQKQNKGLFEVIVYYKKISSALPFFSNYQKLRRQHQAHQKGYEIILKEFGPINIVHLNVLFPAGFFALHLKNKYKIPFIVSENWTAFLKDDPNKISFLQRYYIKKIAKDASVICPVSNDLKTGLINFGIKANYRIVPNVVDTATFYPSKSKHHKERTKVLHISTLNDQHKNITGILDTIKKISLERSDFELNIVSDQDATSYINYARKLNFLDSIVHFHGIKTSTQVAEIMRNNDFFILFSNYENLPCVLVEALASGLPIVTSNVGGISEIINETNGIIVQPRANQEFYSAIKKMLETVQQYDSGQLQNQAVERFSYETVGQTFLSIYKEIIH